MLTALVLAALALLVLGGANIFPTQIPRVVTKSKVISTVSAISADTTDCDESAGYFEIPRGAENIKVTYLVTAQTGYSAGNNYFKAYLVGAHDPSQTFKRQAGFGSGELVTDVAQQLPASSDAQGQVARFVKVEWDETGSITGFTATAEISYDLPAGAGRDASPGYLGG